MIQTWITGKATSPMSFFGEEGDAVAVESPDAKNERMAREIMRAFDHPEAR